YNENIAQTDERVAKYAELMGDDQAAAALAEFKQLATVWKETSSGVIDTMRTGTQSDAIAAMAMSVYKGEPEFNAMREVLNREQERLEALLKVYREEAASSYVSARTMLIGVSLAG